MTTKPNHSTGIKGLSYSKNKRSYIVYKTIDGEQVQFGSRRNQQKAIELHRRIYGDEIITR